VEIKMAGSLLEQMLEAAVKNGGLRGGGTQSPGGLGDILGQVLGGGTGGTTRMPQGGGLGDILGQVLGGAQGSPAGGGLGDILGQVLGGGAAGGGVTGGGRTGGGGTLGDTFRQQKVGVDQGRVAAPDDIEVRTTKPQAPSPPAPAKPAGSSPGGYQIPDTLKRYGGLAILSILAWKVMQSYQKKPGATSPGPSTAGFNPANVPGGADGLSKTLVDAMIAATQADGVVDQGEQKQLLGQLDKLGVDAAERQDLARRMATPIDVAAIVKAATTPEIAVQVYAASAMAIAVDTPEERQYLDRLAQSLKLDPALAKQVEAMLGKG
jgi:uncharacterized membrane protein YebE (DUF533 family)